MCDDYSDFTSMRGIVFLYDRQKRHRYTVHPDDPAFNEDMLTHLWLSDYKPCEVYLQDLDLSYDTDEQFDAIYDYYQQDLEDGIISYRKERIDIAKHFKIFDRYRCDDALRQAYTLPDRHTITIDPLLTFQDVLDDLLRSRRIETYKTVSTDLGYSKSMVSRWVTGDSFPTLQQLMLICMYLQVTAKEGIDLFQTVPCSPSKSNLVEVVFENFLHDGVFHSDFEAPTRDRLVADVHQLLRDTIGVAKQSKLATSLTDLRKISHYFYQEKHPNTQMFVLPRKDQDQAYKTPSCKIEKTTTKVYGTVTSLIFKSTLPSR